jgi:glycosyltransferase involved in cell wall biosynthesis
MKAEFPDQDLFAHRKIAILIPCYNEEKTIGDVVRNFKARLPNAAIYVFDNDSTDRTVQEASKAGAIVRHELRRGKGYVIRSMFREVEAEVYVMVDGDGTYPDDQIYNLIRPVLAGRADMVIGSRLHVGSNSRFKVPNRIGNWLFRGILNFLFRVQVTDLLSGFRAISRDVVKGLPFLSCGFESETELTVKCLERGFHIVEIPIDLAPRPAGSQSKIHILRDGLLILNTLFALARDYRPLTVFGLAGLVLVGCGLIPGIIVIDEYIVTGQILRFPLAILSVGLVLSGLLVLFAGVVLHAIDRRFQELDSQMVELLARPVNVSESGNLTRQIITGKD